MNTAVLCRRMVFTQVLLGIVAACLAEKNPGLLLVAGAIGAMSWYVTEGPHGRFLPRAAVNFGALLATAWLAIELLTWRSQLLAAMSHFILVLQLLMLYARKSDREYSQLLVLSVLQVISASVLSISMLYGVFLGLYCIVALITALLFHLTTAAESVYDARIRTAGRYVARPDTTVTPQARKQLRWAAVVMGLICTIIGIAVFVCLPRFGSVDRSIGTRPQVGQTSTGFSQLVRLDAGPIGNGSREPVLNFVLKQSGIPIGENNDPWLIRGAALDQYDVETRTWQRSAYANAADSLTNLDDRVPAEHDDEDGRYSAEIELRDPNQLTIFSVLAIPRQNGTPISPDLTVESRQIEKLLYSPLDFRMRADQLKGATNAYSYTWPVYPRRTEAFVWPDHPWDQQADEWAQNRADSDIQDGWLSRRWRSWRDAESPELRGEDSQRRSRRSQWRRRYSVNKTTYARGWEVEPEKVRDMAQRIITSAGLERDPQAESTDQDVQIVAALAEHLRRRYKYDLDNPVPPAGKDPTMVFLFDRRRGHCELFAAGLAALSRSVNIPARVITGFHASEFNPVGGYYVVRQSNAHAWVEIYGGEDKGWVAFDATPPAEVQAEHRSANGWLTSIRQTYEHLEFGWIRMVVAFDTRTREAVLGQVDQSFQSTWRQTESKFTELRRRMASLWNHVQFGHVQILTLALCGTGLLLAAGILIRLFQLRRRRVARLQLDRLAPERRRRLSRHLAFYLQMLDLLERHGHHRPAWQSPYHFAHELTQKRPLMFDPVVSLTEIFYTIRFGHQPLSEALRQRVAIHLRQLEQNVVAEPEENLPLFDPSDDGPPSHPVP